MQYRDFYHRDKVGERDIVDLDDSFPQRWSQCQHQIPFLYFCFSLIVVVWRSLTDRNQNNQKTFSHQLEEAFVGMLDLHCLETEKEAEEKDAKWENMLMIDGERFVWE